MKLLVSQSLLFLENQLFFTVTLHLSSYVLPYCSILHLIYVVPGFFAWITPEELTFATLELFDTYFTFDK